MTDQERAVQALARIQMLAEGRKPGPIKPEDVTVAELAVRQLINKGIKEPVCKLTDSGKEEVALALLLWKDFKNQGMPEEDFKVTETMLKFAEILGVGKELFNMLAIVPRMKIEPR